MRLYPKLAAQLAALALCANAGAAIVYFPGEDIPIPSDFAGVSVDFETGTSSTMLDGLPNGDANFFFGGAEITNDGDVGAATPSWQPVRAAAGNTDIALNLALGTPVNAASTYSSGFGSSGDVSPHFPEFTAGDIGFIGFSMVPNAGGAPLFGWAEVTLQTQASGLQGTIHSWAFETDPGVPILVGAIPEPGSAALAIAGLAGLALRRRR